VLTLTTHRKVVVREPAAEVVEQIIAYQSRVHARPAPQIGAVAPVAES
jgi:uncharacterized protein YlzI (FlbEa/FlbD family)